MEFRPKPEIGQHPHPNILLFGPGGSGKTTAALGTAGGKLMLNFDKKNATYYARTYRDPEGEVMEVAMPAYSEGSLVTEALLNEVAVSLSQQAEGDKLDVIADVLIADPIGQLHKRLLEDLTKKALKPSIDADLEVTKVIERWGSFCCDLRITFVMVCHERGIKDEEGGGIDRTPFTGTTNPDLGNRLIEMVDIVGYCGSVEQAEGRVYGAQLFNGNGRKGKSRFPALLDQGGFRALDLRELIETISNPLLEGPADPPVEPAPVEL